MDRLSDFGKVFLIHRLLKRNLDPKWQNNLDDQTKMIALQIQLDIRNYLFI